jgi:5-methylcytosine-specific restriction enzyme subunit McrC
MFKGKLIFNEQIKRNYAHKERNYVEFDEYNINRPENRLIKSTLMYLYHQSSSMNNKRNMKTLLNKFEDVEESSDYEGDYANFLPDRNMKDYQLALLWSQVFLKGKSFTAFSGSGIATSLLFPMEKLFESYVAFKLKKALKSVGFEVKAQDKSHHLFENPNKFLIKPDIVVKREVDKAIFIMDTKWKVLSNDKGHNYVISQSDMYQM